MKEVYDREERERGSAEMPEEPESSWAGEVGETDRQSRPTLGGITYTSLRRYTRKDAASVLPCRTPHGGLEKAAHQWAAATFAGAPWSAERTGRGLTPKTKMETTKIAMIALLSEETWMGVVSVGSYQYIAATTRR